MACASAALSKLRSPAVLVAQNGNSLALPNYMADEIEQSRARIVATLSMAGSRSRRLYPSTSHAWDKSGDDSGEDDDNITFQLDTRPCIRACPSPYVASPRAPAQQQTTSRRFPSGPGPQTRQTSPSPHRQTTSSSESAAITAHQADRIVATAVVSRRPLSASASTRAQAPGGAAAAATAAEQDLVVAVTGRTIQQYDCDDDFLDEEELALDLMAAQHTLARALEMARGGGTPAKVADSVTSFGGGGGDGSSSSSSPSQRASQRPSVVTGHQTKRVAQVVEVEITPASSASSSSLSQQPRSGFTSVRSASTDTGAAAGAGSIAGVGVIVGSLPVAFSAPAASNAGGGGVNDDDRWSASGLSLSSTVNSRTVSNISGLSGLSAVSRGRISGPSPAALVRHAPPDDSDGPVDLEAAAASAASAPTAAASGGDASEASSRSHTAGIGRFSAADAAARGAPGAASGHKGGGGSLRGLLRLAKKAFRQSTGSSSGGDGRGKGAFRMTVDAAEAVPAAAPAAGGGGGGSGCPPVLTAPSSLEPTCRIAAVCASSVGQGPNPFASAGSQVCLRGAQPSSGPDPDGHVVSRPSTAATTASAAAAATGWSGNQAAAAPATAASASKGECGAAPGNHDGDGDGGAFAASGDVGLPRRFSSHINGAGTSRHLSASRTLFSSSSWVSGAASAPRRQYSSPSTGHSGNVSELQVTAHVQSYFHHQQQLQQQQEQQQQQLLQQQQQRQHQRSGGSSPHAVGCSTARGASPVREKPTAAGGGGGGGDATTNAAAAAALGSAGAAAAAAQGSAGAAAAAAQGSAGAAAAAALGSAGAGDAAGPASVHAPPPATATTSAELPMHSSVDFSASLAAVSAAAAAGRVSCGLQPLSSQSPPPGSSSPKRTSTPSAAASGLSRGTTNGTAGGSSLYGSPPSSGRSSASGTAATRSPRSSADGSGGGNPWPAIGLKRSVGRGLASPSHSPFSAPAVAAAAADAAAAAEVLPIHCSVELSTELPIHCSVELSTELPSLGPPAVDPEATGATASTATPELPGRGGSVSGVWQTGLPPPPLQIAINTVRQPSSSISSRTAASPTSAAGSSVTRRLSPTSWPCLSDDGGGSGSGGVRASGPASERSSASGSADSAAADGAAGDDLARHCTDDEHGSPFGTAVGAAAAAAAAVLRRRSRNGGWKPIPMGPLREPPRRSNAGSSEPGLPLGNQDSFRPESPSARTERADGAAASERAPSGRCSSSGSCLASGQHPHPPPGIPAPDGRIGGCSGPSANAVPQATTASTTLAGHSSVDFSASLAAVGLGWRAPPHEAPSLVAGARRSPSASSNTGASPPGSPLPQHAQ